MESGAVPDLTLVTKYLLPRKKFSYVVEMLHVATSQPKPKKITVLTDLYI